MKFKVNNIFFYTDKNVNKSKFRNVVFNDSIIIGKIEATNKFGVTFKPIYLKRVGEQFRDSFSFTSTSAMYDGAIVIDSNGIEALKLLYAI